MIALSDVGGLGALKLSASDASAAVRDIYLRRLGRIPDPQAQGWMDALASGKLTAEQVEQQVTASPEGVAYAQKQAEAPGPIGAEAPSAALVGNILSSPYALPVGLALAGAAVGWFLFFRKGR